MSWLTDYLAKKGIFVYRKDWKTACEIEEHYKTGYAARLEEVDGKLNVSRLARDALRLEVRELTEVCAKLTDEKRDLTQALDIAKTKVREAPTKAKKTTSAKRTHGHHELKK